MSCIQPASLLQFEDVCTWNFLWFWAIIIPVETYSLQKILLYLYSFVPCHLFWLWTFCSCEKTLQVLLQLKLKRRKSMHAQYMLAMWVVSTFYSFPWLFYFRLVDATFSCSSRIISLHRGWPNFHIFLYYCYDNYYTRLEQSNWQGFHDCVFAI